MILGKTKEGGVNDKDFFNSFLSWSFLFEFWIGLFNMYLLVIQLDTCKPIYIIAFLSAVCILICMPEHTSTLKTKRTLFCSGIGLMVMYSLTIKVSAHKGSRGWLAVLFLCLRWHAHHHVVSVASSWVASVNREWKIVQYLEFYKSDKVIAVLETCDFSQLLGIFIKPGFSLINWMKVPLFSPRVTSVFALV